MYVAMYCKYTAVWHVFVKTSDCPSLGTVAGGRLSVLMDIITQMIVRIQCSEGYTLIGKDLNYCQGGKWKHPKATCKSMYVVMYVYHICSDGRITANICIHTT